MSAMQATKAVTTIAGRRSGLSVASSLRGGISTPGQAVALRQTSNSTTVTKRGNGVVDIPSRGMADKSGGSSTKAKPPPAGEPAAAAAPSAADAAASADVPPKTKNNNLLIGTVLVGVAGASYYMTIHKMKDQDFLGDVEKEAEEEAQVNLHKSGLKVSSKVLPNKDDVTASAVAKVEAAVEKVTDEFDTIAQEAEKEMAGATEKAHAAAAAVAATLPMKKDKGEDKGEAKEEPKKKGWRKYIFFGPRRGGGD